MKPNFALDLTHDGIGLLHRSAGGWGLVGEVALDDPHMTESLGHMRRVAEELGDGPVSCKLIIPNSQILYTTVEAPGPDDSAREVQIRVALEGLTPYSVSELVFDWRAEGDTARVAVLARETMDEAEGFAAQFGFNPVSFVARPDKGTFSGEPFFGQTASAPERVVPDGTPVPRRPRQLDLPDVGGVPAPKPAASTPTQAEAVTPTPPEPAPPEQSAQSEPAPVLDPGPPPARDEVKPAAPATPEPAPAPRAPRKKVDTGPVVLDPFPPTLDEGPAPTPAPRVAPVKKAGTETPPPPRREGPALRSSAPPTDWVAPKIAAPLAPEDSEPETPTPSFSSRRTAPATPAPVPPVPTPTAPIPPTPRAETPAQDPEPTPIATPPVAETRSDPIPAPETPVEAPAVSTPETTEAPKPAPVVLDDLIPTRATLSGEFENRRLAMAKALSDTMEPEAEARQGFGARLAGAAGAFNARREARAEEREAKKAELRAAEAAAVRDAITAPLPSPAETEEEDAPKPKPALSRRRKAKDTPEEPDPRAKEAEAMTVFGARRNQAPARRGPKYMGLILVLGLLLLMAAAALWSSLFLGDDDVALFNPDPAVTTDSAPLDTADAGESTPEPEAAVAVGNVLSEAEAEASYATTGVWQRAPESLGDPDVSRSEDIYIASIDPAVEANDALSLPDATNLSTAPPEAAIPPPPPGTSFDLNDQGLVVATPEGAVSPTGVVVFAGQPPRVPAPRPEGLTPPEPEQDAALTDVVTTPDARPRERPEDLTELAERARLGGTSLAELAELRPRARPEGLAPPVDDAVDPDAIDAAVAEADAEPEVPEADLANATDLAVASSIRPGSKPSNFTQVVARVQAAAPASNSGGAQVVAASAAPATVSAIPSSASVTREATMKNALNLREINLIGIYGSNSSRRALVRLSSGRYVKVGIGDRLDGGQVTAISSSRLIYQKSGRQYALDVLPLG